MADRPWMSSKRRSGARGAFLHSSRSFRAGTREQLRGQLTSQTRCVVIAIQVSGNGCAVIQEQELLSEFRRISGAGLASETREPVEHECTRLFAGGLNLVARAIISPGAHEGAAFVTRLRGQLTEQLEYAEYLFLRRVVSRDTLIDTSLPRSMPRLQIATDQLVLTAKTVVQRCLGDPGVLDDPVNPYSIDAVLIEQLIRRGKQALTGARARHHRLLRYTHGLTLPDRSVCFNPLQTVLSAQETLLNHASLAAAPGRATSARQLSPATSFFLLASITVSFLAGSSAPSPLYPIYMAKWGLSPIEVTVIFGVYAAAVLLALLIGGRLSDHVGRRPVLLVATVAQVFTMALFAVATSVTGLLIARVVQGLTTGAAIGAVGAAMIDLDKSRGTVANAVAPPIGTALGGILAGVLVQYLPFPTVLIYGVLGVIFLLQGFGVTLMAESISPRAGVIASLKPQFNLPRATRERLLLALPVLVALWALGGFYAALGPMIIRGMMGSNSPLLGGLALFVLAASGGVSVLLLQRREPREVMTFGALALFVGAAIAALSLVNGAVIAFFLAAAVAGIGFGAGFQGAIRSVVPFATAHERAGVLSIIFVVSYISMGLPAVIAGWMIARNGNMVGTAQIFCAVVMALAFTALFPGVLRTLTKRRNQ